MKKVLERYDEIISDLANQDVFFTHLEETIEQSKLVIFYEDRKFKEKEIYFNLNWN